jgi:hypothetical protein
MEPSGGTDIMENLEYVVSARAAAGRFVPVTSTSHVCGAGCWAAIVEGSDAPLSSMDGGVLSAIM